MIVESNVASTMRDGITLRADVYRPAESGRFPILLARTPYNKAIGAGGGIIDPALAVARGYVVIVQDVRGRFASEGEWIPWKHETEDGYDSVEWAASLPYSNARVGMFGASYFGNTQWRAAISGAPSLAAIAPAVTWATPTDGLYLRGGAPEHGLNIAWGLLTCVDQLVRRERFDLISDIVGRYDQLPEGGYALSSDGTVDLLRDNDLPDIGLHRYRLDERTADESEVISHLDQVTTPALQIAGWYDVFLQGTLDTFSRQRAMGIDSKLIVGPWTHDERLATVSGDRYFGLSSDGGVIGSIGDRTSVQLGFFDEHLRDGDQSPLPPVWLFTMGTNQWRAEQEWPLSRSIPTSYHLTSDGGLSLSEPDAADSRVEFVFDPHDPVPTTGGGFVMHLAYRAGARTQNEIEQRRDVLTFTTDVLAEDLEVTGEVVLELDGESTATSVDWVARLCDVAPDGTSTNLTDGILRTPGERGRHRISLWSTSNVFRAGHRIRVQVTSSNYPRWGLNPAMVAEDRPVQSVYTDSTRSSRLILPVIPTPQS